MTSYSLTWKVSDRHILGMKTDQRESILPDFKPPQRCIGGSGLNLKQENFLVSMPHRFRLNCSDLDREELKTSCNPLSAANVRVKQMTNDKQEPYNQCQIVPRYIGCHELWQWASHFRESIQSACQAMWRCHKGCYGYRIKLKFSISRGQHVLSNFNFRGW